MFNIFGDEPIQNMKQLNITYTNMIKCLSCGVCQKICYIPVKLIVCKHIFCSKCLNSNVCPVCKTSFTNEDVYYHEAARKIINSLKKIHDLNSKVAKDLAEMPANTSVMSNKVKELNKRNCRGETLLHRACIKGDLKAVKDLLVQGASVNTKDFAGWAPLHEAVEKNHVEIVKVLLEAGSIVNAPGYLYITPLHKAVMKGNAEIVILLKKYGANMNLRNFEGIRCKDLATADLISPLATQPSERGSLKLPSLAEYIIFIDADEKEKYQLPDSYTSIPNVTIAKTINESVTHIVTDCQGLFCKVTYNILEAIVKEIPVCSFTWLQESSMKGKVLNPRDYYVNGYDIHTTFMVKKSQENKRCLGPKLFDGLNIYVMGGASNKDSVSVHGLFFNKLVVESLIKMGGGNVLKREPHERNIDAHFYYPWHALEGSSNESCCHYVIYDKKPMLRYNMRELRHMPYAWIVECILNYSLVPPDSMIISY